MKAIHARRKQHDAKLEMAAFDALPKEIRDWLRTANINWECTKLHTRLRSAQAKKTARWGVDRLLQQYRMEDASPAQTST